MEKTVENSAKVVTIRMDEITQNKVDIEVIKHDLASLKESTKEHNAKTEKDFELIHKKIDKIDSRLFWVLGVIIVATVGPLIGSLFT
jgi:hypothetical protein